jgi:ABC-type transport system involved in multi-copper enzyme maturation permease subunit
MRLVLAGLRKLQTRTASIVALIVAALLVGLLIFLIGWSMTLPAGSAANSANSRETLAWFVTFPGAYDAIFALVSGYAGLAAMIYTAAVAGTEWSWGTLKVAVTRGESRTRYVVATFGSLAIALLIGVVVTFLAGMVGAIGGAIVAGVPLRGFADGDALPHLASLLVRCWIAVCCICAVAYAIAMLFKNQMAGVGMVIGVYLVAVFVPVFLPESVRQVIEYQPFSIASDAIGLIAPPSATAGTGARVSVESNLALLVTLAWIVASLLVAAVATERAEITS